VITLEHDSGKALVVAWLSSGGEMQDDFGQLIGLLEKALGQKNADQKLAIMVVMESGHALPNAFWRSRAAEVTGRDDFDGYLAIVTQNKLIRGVLTALDWLRDKSYQDKVFPSVEEAKAWLEQERGDTFTLIDIVNRRMSGKRAAGA
jgi:hypothetical protein